MHPHIPHPPLATLTGYLSMFVGVFFVIISLACLALALLILLLSVCKACCIRLQTVVTTLVTRWKIKREQPSCRTS